MLRFVQDNYAGSTGKVLRGLHYQIRPQPSAKDANAPLLKDAENNFE